MIEPKLTEAIERQLSLRWSDFAAKHPRLAEELQFDWHVAAASELLRNDPRYQNALRRGLASEGLLEALRDAIGGVVEVVLKR